MKPSAILCLTAAFAWSSSVFSAPFKDAKVNHSFNDVRVADGKKPHAATPQEVVRDTSAVFTGIQSRAELVFPDRTMTRLGAETSLRFQPGTRHLLLERGTLLLQVPRFHSGARVRLGSLTATLGCGTALIEHLPGNSVKLCVIEGDLRISVNGFLGDSLVLGPGKMLITTPGVRRIPDPVDVDLRTLATTSTLINPSAFLASSTASAATLPSQSQMVREIERQEGLVRRKTLFPTNLAIVGSGTSVTIPGASGAGQSVILDAPPRMPVAEAPAGSGIVAAHGSGPTPDQEADLPVP